MKNLKIKNKLPPLIVLVVTLGLLGFFLLDKKEAKIIFVGDIFFDRSIRKVIYKEGGDHIFSCIGDFLKNSDMVVGNLEGPITENASVSLVSQVGAPDNFTFTFPTLTADLLAKNNIKIVTLGNNHIGNFGQEGIVSTRKYLKEAGVEYFGGLRGELPNGEAGEPILRKEIRGHKLSLIAYNEFGGASKEDVAKKIKAEKATGQKVIVFAHWGEEYIPAVGRVKATAKLFAESGADLIVGAHPHVIQESENLISPQPSLYPKERVTAVYYSLGNFIFDQYWNSEVSTGLVLEVKIKDDDFKITEHRVSINRDGTTCLKD